MKQKILYLITKSNWGGAQRYVYDLATTLPHDTYDVVVVLGGDGELKTRLDAAHVRTRTIWSLKRDVHLKDEVASFFSILRIIREERPAILHINSSKAGALGALAGRLAHVPKIIFTAHGWAFNEDRGILQRGLLTCIYWLTVLLAHKTIAVSEAVKAQMAKYPFMEKKMHVIKNGVAPINFFEKEQARTLLVEKSEALRQRNNTSATRWIGTIGELHPIKGHTYMIEAMQKIIATKPDVIFCIISEGTERETLTKQIHIAHLQDSVFLLGKIPDAARYLKAFDLFVLPSLSEALAFVILEAGQAGLPCIATRVGGIPEVIEHEVSGLLVPAKNSDTLAQATLRLLNDTPLCTTLATQLSQTVNQTFTQDKMVKETISCYSDTI